MLETGAFSSHTLYHATLACREGPAGEWVLVKAQGLPKGEPCFVGSQVPA